MKQPQRPQKLRLDFRDPPLHRPVDLGPGIQADRQGLRAVYAQEPRPAGASDRLGSNRPSAHWTPSVKEHRIEDDQTHNRRNPELASPLGMSRQTGAL